MDNVVDFKKRDKALYSPKTEPAVIEVPELSFIGIEGKGNPNEEGGAKEFTGDKTDFEWLSVIRLPDYVNQQVFDWACGEAARKKKVDTGKAKLLIVNEGLCVQCMHIGSFDDEPATVERMHKFIDENGLALDITDIRHHHEIYLSDPRKGDVAKMKTIIRLPVRKK
jgi:hypothetical protein